MNEHPRIYQEDGPNRAQWIPQAAETQERGGRGGAIMEGQAKYINLSHSHLAGNHKRKSKHNYIIHKNLTHNVMQFDH